MSRETLEGEMSPGCDGKLGLQRDEGRNGGTSKKATREVQVRDAGGGMETRKNLRYLFEEE